MPVRKCGVLAVVVSVALGLVTSALPMAAQGAGARYPVAAPLDQYLMEKNAEVALARSAAPVSISGGAEVLVLGRDGYTTVAPGGNGFVCLVERSFAAAVDFPEFWNPKIRGPICVNPEAAKTYLQVVRLEAKLAMAGKSREEIAAALKTAWEKKELTEPGVGAMSYMMSKKQYLGDEGHSWHPHLMWFAAGDAAKSWGANVEGSPVMAAPDLGDRMTIFLVAVGKWSDGTAAPVM
ncbi:hypothetical protein [Granulicella sp. L46]|uniref:hypothetical protein n=1 Tax=Granulicella sp. L46 TaxID=1641865 RepID=UPI001C20BC13|nr:hypothetical protein [Granulicella sp. L46]